MQRQIEPQDRDIQKFAKHKEPQRWACSSYKEDHSTRGRARGINSGLTWSNHSVCIPTVLPITR